MDIHALYRQANSAIVDYCFLQDALSDYANPRQKIASFLKKRELIRVKKGLYVFNDQVAKEPYAKEILANLIYGPSYISKEYALSFYGLIPEQVKHITSVTNKRNKQFDTPIGRFTYRYQRPEFYPLGVTQRVLNEKFHIVIATKEKALIDTMADAKVKDADALPAYLHEELRIDKEDIKSLDSGVIKTMVDAHLMQAQLLIRYIACI